MMISLRSVFLILQLLSSLAGGVLTACPYKLLESAFEVRVDLERKDGGEMLAFCSAREKTIVANLLQKGIEKASSRLAKNYRLRSFSSFGASVCKHPATKESRRQLSESTTDERSLRSRSIRFFRYYGTMRCKLCDKENDDASFLPERCPLDCNFITIKSKYDEINQAYLGHIGNLETAATKTLKMVTVDFAVYRLQPGQSVRVTINEHYTLDLNHERFRNVATSQSEHDDGLDWSISPMQNKPDGYKIYLKMRKGLPCSNLWPSIMNKKSLDVTVSFHGDGPVPRLYKFWTSLGVENCPEPKNDQEVQWGMEDSPHRQLSHGGSTTSVSTSACFRSRVHRTLMIGLNRDLKNHLPADHCMHGKGIHAKVHLTPKPEWEKNLPTCGRR